MNGVPKKTKIVCTIGPSSWDPEVMREMIASGMNIARVNGAFADRAELDKVTSLVRNVSDKVGLMVDVKGPEIRMNKFGDAKAIKPGDQIIIGSTDQDEIYPANYMDVYKHIQPGQRILIGDGDVELKVTKVEDGKMYCEVQYGELFKPGKALNMPGANYASSTLTEKDIENLKYAVSLGWDSVSASFIQNAEAAREVRQYLEGSKMQLIAKIEDQNGVNNIDEILQEVDGIMIARGGLGVELGLEKVPMVQKHLIEKANAAGKIVITATQMLESMITNPRPTRAEVNDVAMAIYAGTDAVMLSGESSAGKYPIEAVKEMAKIAMEIEPQIEPHILNTRAIGAVEADSISKAAAQLCMDMDDELDSVIVLSRRGRTARLMGRHNVKQPIHVFVTKGEYVRQLALAKITDAFVMPKSYTDRDEVINDVIAEAKSKGIVKDGQTVLFLSRTPLDEDEKFPSLFEIVKI